MAKKIRDFLPPDAYRNYRNVRAAALMFVVLGTILVLAGIVLVTALGDEGRGVEPPPKALGVVMSLIGSQARSAASR